MSKRKFLLGAVVGATAGVVAGMLTAPKSGKETRADLKEKAQQLKSDASAKGDELRAKGGQVYHDTKKAARDLQQRGERAVRSAREEFRKEK